MNVLPNNCEHLSAGGIRSSRNNRKIILWWLLICFSAILLLDPFSSSSQFTIPVTSNTKTLFRRGLSFPSNHDFDNFNIKISNDGDDSNNEQTIELVQTLVPKVTEATRITGSAVSLSTSGDEQFETQHFKIEEMSILAFGASRTYGATLQNRESEAFPFLMSPQHSWNMGIRATGPDYPSLCCYSMLRNITAAKEHIDVILLEYYLDASYYLLRLAKRLRHRYPRAIIIILRIWGPLQYTFLEGGDEKNQHVHGLRYMQLLHGHSWKTKTFWDLVRNSSSPSQWKFDPYPNAIAMQEYVANQVGAHIWKMPPHHAHHIVVDPIAAMMEYRHWFAPDMIHLSKQGHAAVAYGLRSFLQHIMMRMPTTDQPSNNLLTGLRPWNGLDSCESWYETGKIASSTLRFSPEIHMSQFKAGTQKYALEIPGRPTDNISWIEIAHINNHNHTGGYELYMTYMKTTPPPGIYPKVKVSIGHGANAILVDPTGRNKHSRVHVNKVAHLGRIPQGKSFTNITITVLEPEKEHPFRITGYILTPLMELIESMN